VGLKLAVLMVTLPGDGFHDHHLEYLLSKVVRMHALATSMAAETGERADGDEEVWDVE